MKRRPPQLSASDLACAALDRPMRFYTHKGWYQVARNLANRLLDESLEVERLTRRVHELEKERNR